MRLDLPFIEIAVTPPALAVGSVNLNSLSQEDYWKPGDRELFFFENWNLSL